MIKAVQNLIKKYFGLLGIAHYSSGHLSHFPRQSLKIFTFCVKLSDSIFFLLGLSPTAK
jgi:hypothetical protein